MVPISTWYCQVFARTIVVSYPFHNFLQLLFLVFLQHILNAAVTVLQFNKYCGDRFVYLRNISICIVVSLQVQKTVPPCPRASD